MTNHLQCPMIYHEILEKMIGIPSQAVDTFEKLPRLGKINDDLTRIALGRLNNLLHNSSHLFHYKKELWFFHCICHLYFP
uniref:Uncharacterized protein n=1 Tax=Arundo donax TaxID=35708 RepID=A0A0A8Z345_ARUDO